MPGSPECLCCYKLWQEDYCQFITADLESIKKASLKTINKIECSQCENNPDSKRYKKLSENNKEFWRRLLFKCGNFPLREVEG